MCKGSWRPHAWLQEETHTAALTAQREQLQNPARDAEMCLLRDENRALKVLQSGLHEGSTLQGCCRCACACVACFSEL